MYARISTIQVKPGTIDSTAMKDATKEWRELTVAQKKEGGKGGLLLVDRSTNKVISISTWETEAAMKTSERGHRERVSKGNPIWAGSVTTEHCEIVVQV